MSLSNQQRRHLRGLSHALKPVVAVAGKGLSEAVMSEIESALDQHELIKIRLRSDRDTREQWAAKIALQCAAEVVQKIGQIACYYRRNPKKPLIELPRT